MGVDLRRHGCQLSEDGTLAAVGDGDVIRIWNLETGVELPPFIGHDGLISVLQFADQGRTLFSGDIEGGPASLVAVPAPGGLGRAVTRFEMSL
jgi:WD40 repeat protein